MSLLLALLSGGGGGTSVVGVSGTSAVGSLAGQVSAVITGVSGVSAIGTITVSAGTNASIAITSVSIR